MRALFVAAFGLALQVGTSHARAAEPLVIDAGPEWALTVSGQLRPRVIAHSGLDLRGSASEWREHVSQRARLGVRAEAASGLAVTLELQDVRIWGEEAAPDDFSADGLDLHRAFATLPLHPDIDLSVGRLELSLDDERLLGRSDFSQRARAFDGGHLVWGSVTGRFTVEALYAKIGEAGTSPDGHVQEDVPGDVDFGGVHASVEVLPGHLLAPAYLVQIDQAPSHVRHTAGLHAKGEVAPFSYRAEGYYQYGKTGSRTISAYLAAARVGLTLDHDLAPGVALFADLLSGNGTPESAFDTLYGSDHGYYGEMDFFSQLPADTAGRGLVDLGAHLESGLTKDLRVQLDAHWLRTTTQVGESDANLGVEMDTKIRWAPTDYVTVEGFVGVFLPRGGMFGLRGAPGGGTLHADLLTHLTTNVRF